MRQRPFLHFFIFWRINRTNGILVEQQKNMLQMDEQKHFQIDRMDIAKCPRVILFVKWLCYSTETEKLRNFTGSVVSIVVRQAFYHFLLLPWYEPSFLRSHSLVSSRFKCNNKRTIEHSFELNSTNKSIIELIWLKWLGINRRFSFDIDVICGKKSKTLAPISLFSIFFAWFSVKYTVYLAFLRVSFLRIQQSLVTTYNRQSTYRMDLNEHLAKKKLSRWKIYI